ncbi:MAG TPA: SpoIIE family protein phosphatase [Bryobacteraceae bacterium]|nr:SpoIIE family protein phosphatase [Bryobacteraceae bacterium]
MNGARAKRSAKADSLERKQFRQQLALKNRALDATAEGITIADARRPDNPLIYANEGFERLTGYGATDVIGRNCRFLQGVGTDHETLERLRAAIREKREITVQLLNYRRDGTPFWNRLSITPVRGSDGEVTHFIGVQSDVTDQKNAADALEAANRAMRRDLEAAAKVQQSLLPASLPKVHGINLAWLYQPCQELAGDSLNVFLLDDHDVGLYILDVSGHGVAAALLSVTLSHFLLPLPGQSLLYDADRPVISTPSQVVEKLNARFPLDPRSPQFFTMLYGVLDRRTDEFRYVLAGHTGPVYVPRDGEPTLLEAGGLPAGLFPGVRYEDQVIRLGVGDRLYFYTDGIVESENAAGDDFGNERLLKALDSGRTAPLAESINGIIEEVVRWHGPGALADDASLLALEVCSKACDSTDGGF